jgi:3-oxoacyl-[acyl-carrier protein] reductase
MPKTPDYFQNKTIVITGAASGIGRATALIFAREGANVVCADIDAESARRTAETAVQRGVRALGIATDVTSRQSVEDMVAQAIAVFCAVDFAFFAAGGAVRQAAFTAIDDALFDRTFDLNVKGVFYGMQGVLPHMLANGQGVIVNIASMAHKRGGPGVLVHYAAAKAAVLTMTLGVAREYADRGIRCLSISPGPVRTGFHAASDTSAESIERSVAAVPMKRIGEPEEIGELALFMCSDACTYMTADTVYVNGGGGWR